MRALRRLFSRVPSTRQLQGSDRGRADHRHDHDRQPAARPLAWPAHALFGGSEAKASERLARNATLDMLYVQGDVDNTRRGRRKRGPDPRDQVGAADRRRDDRGLLARDRPGRRRCGGASAASQQNLRLGNRLGKPAERACRAGTCAILPERFGRPADLLGNFGGRAQPLVAIGLSAFLPRASRSSPEIDERGVSAAHYGLLDRVNAP